MEKRRMISDAARELGVETHVLRYWEEELDLPIPRNEMGHRFYGENEMKLLNEVKEQKKKGAQLKEIKAWIPEFMHQEYPKEKEGTKVIPFPNEQNEKMQQFQEIMVKIVGQALKNHEHDLSTHMGNKVADRVVREMDYHFREQEELEKERYRRFDEMMRNYQQARAEIAAMSEHEIKRRFFGRKKEKD